MRRESYNLGVRVHAGERVSVRPRGQPVRTRVIILSIIVAVAAWLAALYTAFIIPGSPFQELPAVVERVSDPRTGPAAFDEFLAVGERTKVIGAIVFPLVAAVAVLLLSRFRVQLSWSEALVVMVVFSAFLSVWSGGIGYFAFADLASIVIFVLIVALGVGRPRSTIAV